MDINDLQYIAELQLETCRVQCQGLSIFGWCQDKYSLVLMYYVNFTVCTSNSHVKGGHTKSGQGILCSFTTLYSVD